MYFKAIDWSSSPAVRLEVSQRVTRSPFDCHFQLNLCLTILKNCLFILFRSVYFSQHIQAKLPALYQLSEGVNIRNLLQIIRKSPSGFKKLFVIEQGELKCDDFLNLFEPKYSDIGSNAFMKEQELFQAFLDFVESTSYDGELNKITRIRFYRCMYAKL